jgi:hypothetical protein
VSAANQVLFDGTFPPSDSPRGKSCHPDKARTFHAQHGGFSFFSEVKRSFKPKVKKGNPM